MQRPTTLKIMARHCPVAIQRYEDGTPYDRGLYAVGTAAHDVLHALAVSGPDAVAGTVAALLAVGRAGVDAEPPLSPDAVFAGRDLALAWHAAQGGVLGSERATYEVGLAVAADWSPCPYDDPGAFFRARLDVLDVLEDEDEDGFGGTILVCRDYKTAWPTDAAVLGSVQLRAQAVLAWLSWDRIGLADAPDAIRREVVNLRTRQSWSETTVLDADGIALLESWRRDLDLLVRAAEVRPRVASPSMRCLGCPWATRCEPAAAFVRDGRRGAAERYAVAVALSDALAAEARAASEQEPVPVPGGVVGTVAVERREPGRGAALALWERWVGTAPAAEVPALARGFAAAADFGVAQIRAVAKALLPDRKQKVEREALAELYMTTTVGRRFGVHAAAPAEPDGETP